MNRKEMSPAAVAPADGARDASQGCKRPDNTTGPKGGKRVLNARIPPDGEPFTVNGRLAQTLVLLMTTGARGFTSGEASPLAWARRTSAYVHKLRCLGVPIATTREATSDGAVVARYRLAGAVVLIERAPETE